MKLIYKIIKNINKPLKVWYYFRNYFVLIISKSYLRFWIYPAYWRLNYHKLLGHFKFYNNKNFIGKNNKRYISIIPNQGAGIGHQFCNWNTALIFAHLFKLNFVHYPLKGRWDDFLGFGKGEIQYKDIKKNKSIKKVRLPLIRGHNDLKGNKILNDLINNNYKKDILFILETDQSYYDQTITAQFLKEKYWKNKFRSEPNNNFSKNNLNIAVHIRRGDIVQMKKKNEGNWEDRWMNNLYFVKIIENVKDVLKEHELDIHIYSQGNKEEFLEFDRFKNVTYHLNEDELASSYNIVLADILILSPSGFSYLAAIISYGLKIAKYPWWHYIPEDNEWFRSNSEGVFDFQKFKEVVKEKFKII